MTTIASLMSMTGRRALITGAAGGIGRVIAQTLAELGAEVVLVDRPGADCPSVADAVGREWGVTARTIECDLELQSERGRMIESVLSDGRGLDVLVNNAAFTGSTGLKGWVADFEEQSVETWRRAIEVNVTAAFDLTKGFASALGKSPAGSVINIGSIYGIFGPDHRLYADTTMGNPAAYAASKGGLIQLTRWLSTTLAPAVRVNVLSPGGVFRGQPDAFVQRYEARTPLGRMATEEDFRGAVAYLASDLSRYVTGQNLVVDGGWGVW